MSVAITMITLFMLSTSYAWYSFTNAITPFSVETFEDDLAVAVLFTNDNNISTVVGVPLTTDEVNSKASKCLFTVTPDSSVLNGRNVAIAISLENLSIASELTAVSDLNYSLLQTVDGTTTTIASGNFSGVTSSSLLLKSMYEITSGKTYSFEFRLWLHETGGDQNSLMGKKISGVIKVSSALK